MLLDNSACNASYNVLPHRYAYILTYVWSTCIFRLLWLSAYCNHESTIMIGLTTVLAAYVQPLKSELHDLTLTVLVSNFILCSHLQCIYVLCSTNLMVEQFGQLVGS